MSIDVSGMKTEYLYVGTQPRKPPGKGHVYTITTDKVSIYGAPAVTLYVGQTYEFVIDTPGHPFYITTSNTGGGSREVKTNMIGRISISREASHSLGNVGIDKGRLTWTPRKEHVDMSLFYQCNHHKNMGNALNVSYPPNSGF